MDRSYELFTRASKVIPGGVNSPVRSLKNVGMSPLFFSKGQGAYLTGVDGKQYVDFCLSFGPHLFGHCPSFVVKAIQEQALSGTSFGACHAGEARLAELILRAYPFLGKVRLVNSGTEALMTAVRIARGYTGRDKILKFEGCYHGHSDVFLVKAGSGVADLPESGSKGVPRSAVADTVVTRLGDISVLEAAFRAHPRQIAAVVVEPVPANHGLWIPDRAYLSALVGLARAHGALVLFDEVITGFRVGISGASGAYDLKPDLVTLGKIIGGGMPLAAVAGRTDIMEVLAPLGDVYQAGTLSGNPINTSVGCAVLEQIFASPPYDALSELTAWFTDELKDILTTTGFGPVSISRMGSLFWIAFKVDARQFPPEISQASKEKFSSFFQKALRAGAYFPPSPYEVGFLSTAHTKEMLRHTLEKLCESLDSKSHL